MAFALVVVGCIRLTEQPPSSPPWEPGTLLLPAGAELVQLRSMQVPLGNSARALRRAKITWQNFLMAFV
ncbi:hypothetical protein Cadr_000022396 [Camelus dromedarius]|uniref:Uncharacterized protein n=1 Tax=Camelus dromedarius TaxID=9838 RepID=A0A5N4CSB9_CAMDR|nr:hypothetical protein Cadr_000022396 [Camelus dromedarius]